MIHGKSLLLEATLHPETMGFQNETEAKENVKFYGYKTLNK